MKKLHFVTFILLAVGGLNWGLVGIFEFNLVAYLLGDMTMIARVVYTLVGLSAVAELVDHCHSCKYCDKK